MVIKFTVIWIFNKPFSHARGEGVGIGELYVLKVGHRYLHFARWTDERTD
jgi:hypothetical protein